MTITKEHLVESILKIVDSRKKALQVVETLQKPTTQSLENGVFCYQVLVSLVSEIKIKGEVGEYTG